jgi:hypothetical protein
MSARRNGRPLRAHPCSAEFDRSHRLELAHPKISSCSVMRDCGHDVAAGPSESRRFAEAITAREARYARPPDPQMRNPAVANGTEFAGRAKKCG